MHIFNDEDYDYSLKRVYYKNHYEYHWFAKEITELEKVMRKYWQLKVLSLYKGYYKTLKRLKNKTSHKVKWKKYTPLTK